MASACKKCGTTNANVFCDRDKLCQDCRVEEFKVAIKSVLKEKSCDGSIPNCYLVSKDLLHELEEKYENIQDII